MKYLYFALVLSIFSCTDPNINYLGNDFESTENVDVYYSPYDVDPFFSVMGQMNADNENDESLSLDNMEESMICEAKERGADAILFLNFETIGDLHYIEADLLIYD